MLLCIAAKGKVKQDGNTRGKYKAEKKKKVANMWLMSKK